MIIRKANKKDLTNIMSMYKSCVQGMIKNNIDPNMSSSSDIIPSAQENMLSLFIGSKAAGFFTKSKNIDKDKYGFEKRI